MFVAYFVEGVINIFTTISMIGGIISCITLYYYGGDNGDRAQYEGGSLRRQFDGKVHKIGERFGGAIMFIIDYALEL
jgi:hypothetical protein